MIAKFIIWFMALLRRDRLDIDRPNQPVYLTRWTLLGKRFSGYRRLYLHWFHRGDLEDYPHDHPWDFKSLILWGGYWEITPRGRRWYGPGAILFRPAAWQHRVELPEGRSCWTLVLTGPKVRSWGFWCSIGFLPWRQHAANLNRGLPGCGED